MHLRNHARSFFRVLFISAILLSLMISRPAAGYAAGNISLDESNVKLTENCTADVNGGALVVTDTDDNNDVWSSKFLADAGMELTPGEQYKLSFSLAGENGVGEFFLCKSENIDDRYDVTFSAEEGSRSISFTAEGNKVYIGMQVGNLGKGHSVTAEISGLCKLSESESPALLRTENCSVSISDGVIVATDTGENNDVWNSKLLYDAGVALEIGKTYKLNIELSGDNGVGEFFVCKSPDLNDRYDATFVNSPGARSVVFKAESDKLFIGMQFGNLGKGNTVTAVIGEPSETAPAAPAAPKQEEAPGDPNAVNCRYTVNGNVITVTDLGSNNDVWDSRLLYDAGLELVVGKKYELRFSLDGDNGVGEFFLCRSMDINDRYDETFSNASGVRTVVFVAESTRAYIGMQVGNLGSGNSVSLTIEDFKEYDDSAQTAPRVVSAENCSYEVDTSNNTTVINATDTSDNPDVWNSKILYYLGAILEQGRIYAANFNLSGDNGVGEFFLCKTADLNDRYDGAFANTAGDHTRTFAAVNSDLYAGMQFGNIGNGNDVTYTIGNIFRIPGLLRSSVGCSESFGQDSITLTDTSDNNGIWESKALYTTGIVLEPGQTYTATFTLNIADGAGEFFFLKSENEDPSNRYEGTFKAESGEYTVTFTAADTELFFGIQCGNVGRGSSVTLSNLSVTLSESGRAMLGQMMSAAAESEETEEAAPEEAAPEEAAPEEAAPEEAAPEEAAPEEAAPEEAAPEEEIPEEEAPQAPESVEPEAEGAAESVQEPAEEAAEQSEGE